MCVALWLHRAASCINQASTKGGPILPLTAFPFPLYVMHTSPPRHCRISATSTSISPSLWPVRHVTRPGQPTHRLPCHPAVPDPTSDIMLTSSIKKAPKTNFFIFCLKNMFFLILHKLSTVSFACVLRCFLCQPPEIRPWVTSAPNSARTVLPPSRYNQVFTHFFCKLFFSVFHCKNNSKSPFLQHFRTPMTV